MPAGDPQRTWFPEMVTELRKRWRPGLSIADLIHLRDDVDSMLRRIRSDRNISTPIIRCRVCGNVGPAAAPKVSVRATILALGRFGITPARDAKTLEKRWTTRRKLNGLDLDGKQATLSPTPVGMPMRKRLGLSAALQNDLMSPSG